MVAEEHQRHGARNQPHGLLPQCNPQGLNGTAIPQSSACESNLDILGDLNDADLLAAEFGFEFLDDLWPPAMVADVPPVEAAPGNAAAPHAKNSTYLSSDAAENAIHHGADIPQDLVRCFSGKSE